VTDVIEGTAVEVPAEPEVRTLVVAQQPGQVVVSTNADPRGMVAVASDLATVLKDIVERQRLYAVISGKKYPQVEAWMTIARLDNVVARESRPPIEHEDGSYEAFAELIRLSDGMVIGSASALCGTPDDKPWSTRAKPARRSMAQTRATSRAFRQQYSWIMALAGYEPTPAEEMPRDEPAQPKPDLERDTDGSIIGVAEATDKALSDFTLKAPAADGLRSLGFRLTSNGGHILVETRGDLAEQLDAYREAVIGQRVTVWGAIEERRLPKGGKYLALVAARVRVPEIGDLPASAEAPSVPMFDGLPADQQAELDGLEF
jgi:hypothetical protein